MRIFTRWLIGCCVSSIATAGALAADTPNSLVIDGAIAKTVTLSTTELASLPHVAVRRMDHGKLVECEGVPAIELLRRAGLPSGEALRGPALTTVVIATARDGYKVAFTLAELDGSLGDAGAVVADRCDHQALDREMGPLRLILPRDERPARSVRQFQRFTIIAKP